VWTFNKDGNYSSGTFVSATPRDRIIPQGVNYANITPRILPGVRRDQYTQLIYNFSEKFGNTIYDSSGTARHGIVGNQTILDNFWLGDSQSSVFIGNQFKSPAGVLFDGKYDIITTSITDTKLSIIGNSASALPQALTVNFWVFRYSQGNIEWVIGTTNQAITNLVGWAIGLNANGNILLSVQSSVATGFSITTSAVIPEKQWTMVTLTVDTDSTYTIYLNGIQFSSAVTYGTAVDTSSFDQLMIGAKLTSDIATWTGSDYFGCLSQISISNTLRNQAWIEQTFNLESQVFNRTIDDVAINPPDNLQRENLLNWKIGEDFNFSGGKIKIVRKYRDIPSHDEDGDVVLEEYANSGDFYFLDSFDFIHNSNYYYRIFTYNSLNNPCERIEARVLPVYIAKSDINDSNFVLGMPGLAKIISGNKKLKITWTNSTDTNVIGTKIFFNIDSFPTINISAKGDLTVSNGKEIFDTTEQVFVHKIIGKTCNGEDILLTNGQLYYYTIIHYDQYGRISDPLTISGIPDSTSTEVFIPDDVNDLHISIVNSSSLAIQWKNPTIKNERLDLFFNENALVLFDIKDIYGDDLTDLENVKIFVCTTIEQRGLTNNESKLQSDQGFGSFDTLFNPQIPCDSAPLGSLSFFKGNGFGTNFNINCNTPEAQSETIVLGKSINGGLINGLVTNTSNKDILKRRERYVMNVFALYRIQNQEAIDPESDSATLFKFITKPLTVTFTNPIQIRTINKLQKFIVINCNNTGGVRILDNVCSCVKSDKEDSCDDKNFNGGYIGAKIPYVCRVEIQYKGESLPDGYPVNVELFEHNDDLPLSIKSDRTTITEGRYLTTAITEDEIDNTGQPTGKTISKSMVDIEIQHPSLPDDVDLYITVDYGGIVADTLHEIRFISSLFIHTNITKPRPDGIEAAEQFANVWQVDPDDPDNTNSKNPVPDGTPVKWELIPLRHGRSRPFYSTDRLNTLVSGVYSLTESGVARHIFFGPVGNLQKHTEQVVCKDSDGAIESADSCCLAEEYEIVATVAINEQTAQDKVKIAYACEDKAGFSSKRFLMNAADDQPGSDPHWITWADGTGLLKFQIAKNPSISTMRGASCFRECVEEKFNQQLFTFANGQIIQITAPGEILWNVTFETDPYSGIESPSTYSSAKPNPEDPYNTVATANIPISGDTTDFYLRLNKFIPDTDNPKPQECKSTESGGSGQGSSGEDIDPCEWKFLCGGIGTCTPEKGKKWVNVSTVSGVTTLISKNKEITLFGGGDYQTGIPPIYAGFKEPLSVAILDARVNGQSISELQVDGFSTQTFVVEVTFANDPVPDGTPIELTVDGDNQSIIKLSSNIIYTKLINDSIINPSGPLRSLAFFSIDPLPNVEFSTKINTTCHYDKLGTAKRTITRCILLTNHAKDQSQQNDTNASELNLKINSATSNELIVYDTVNNSYSTQTGGQINRMGHFFAACNVSTTDKIFAFGGWTGNSDSSTANITPTSEFFDIATEQWNFTTNMPTARCFGMTVIKESKIYCIGGIELDSLLRQHIVSKKIEAFDVITETWDTTLIDMPENYGVAYGDAQLVGNYIYVTCGITNIIDNSTPGTLNDRILRYSIGNNTWDTIIPSDVGVYTRISPFGFYKDNSSGINHYYIYGGALQKGVPQIETERTAKINELLNELHSFLLTSTYFQNLTVDKQQEFIANKEADIRNSVVIPSFIYPKNGFKFVPGSEFISDNNYFIDVSDSLEDEWHDMPLPRSFGKCIYNSNQNIAYFIGGSNQNLSTTLNKMDAIDIFNDNNLETRTALNRGRSMFAANLLADNIYISGGLTSGHDEGWCQITVQNKPEFIETLGIQSGGVFVTITNDSGELLTQDINVEVLGEVHIEDVDNLLIGYAAKRAADRALGGDGSGNAPNKAQAGDTLDINKIKNLQNTVVDPNSDEFQLNATTQLQNKLALFPVLYSKSEFTIRNGIGSTTLLPRSEDPLSDILQLAAFIKTLLDNTPVDQGQLFNGFTRDELASLGDALAAVMLSPTIVDSGALRSLYTIETTLTILDDFYFGQTVGETDLAIQKQTQDDIAQLLTPPSDNQTNNSDNLIVTNSKCFVLQHSAQQDISQSNTPPQSNDPNNPGGTGGFAQSGQSLFSSSILPLNIAIRDQNFSPIANYFNVLDWIPQIQERLITNDSSLSDTLNEINKIKYETPFGGSQLYDALFKSAQIMSDDDFDTTKKVIYVLADNVENLSTISRDTAITEVNSIDGDKKVPIVETVFSTSFPVTLSALLEQTEINDVEKLVSETGGQANLLISSDFMDEILNLTISGATGGLGYGTYIRQIKFDELVAITGFKVLFDLSANTNGSFKYRYSKDGYTFGDFSSVFIGSQLIEFSDFFAKIIEIEIVLTTGFSTDTSENNETTANSVPKCLSITVENSAEREDFVFLNKDTSPTNIQQIAMAFEGTIPPTAIVELGTATSDSHQWNDFQSKSRPSVNELGKMFMIERSENTANDSIIPPEPLFTNDNILYTSIYGPWDPNSTIKLFYLDENSTKIPVLDGFKLYPRDGQIYFNTQQNPTKVFEMQIINTDDFRVGIRLRNRLHTSSIQMEGVGFIYSTNSVKQTALGQIPPKAINILISPSSPNSGSTFSALYKFIDLNNNTEVGSIISWYKNNIQLLEIQNKLSWTNDSLLLTNKLKPGDKIQFSVTPSDGTDYGTTVYSANIMIGARSPEIQSAQIISVRNGVNNDRFDTSGTLQLDYTFVSEDIGGIEDGTNIKWFVNGVIFKENTFSAVNADPYTSPKSIQPGEVSNGFQAHVIGNIVQVEITPRTALASGTVVTTASVTISNSLPLVKTITIAPASPTTQSTLILSYAIDDRDIDSKVQQDKSTIKWFVSKDGKNYSEQTELVGSKTVSPFYLTKCDTWYAQIVPNDGVENGPSKNSNILKIG